MEVRCQSCHARLSVPSVGSIKEIQCPKCGVMMTIPEPHQHHHGPGAEARAEKQHDDRVRRIFDPIPRPVLYVAGAVLGLLILSPFWAYVVVDSFQRKPVFLEEDAQSIPVPTNAQTTAATQIINTNGAAPFDLTEFSGVRLGALRNDIDPRFSLALQNTRGMQPEVYVGRDAGEVEQINAQFYNGVLKEFTLWMRERQVPATTIERELIERYGVPREREESQGNGKGIGITGLGIGNDVDGTAKKLAMFPNRRRRMWTDGQNRVDATVYFTNIEDAQPFAMLEIHIAAAVWLKANNPAPRTTAPVSTGLPDRPILPVEKKLTP